MWWLNKVGYLLGQLAVYTAPGWLRSALLFAYLPIFITQAFLSRFLYCLYQWKQERIVYKVVKKIYHFTLSVSPHYLVKLKTTYKQHIL